MRWIALFLFVPLVCPAAEWSTAAPDSSGWSTAVASIPDATGEPTVTVLPCQCGDVCECDPCECPGCPHRKAVATTERRPPLTILTAFDGCAPCNRFKSDAIPRLKAAGWKEGRDYAIYTMPIGTVPLPSFSWRSESFGDGYGTGIDGWNKWRAELAEAMGVAAKPVESVRVTHDAQSHDAAKPVQIHHAVPRSVPPARRQWSYSGSNLAEHLRQTHGVDPTGMSHRDMVNAHSHAHEGTWNGVASGARYSQPVYSSGCPGGNCPSSSRSRGLFGGLFR